MLLPVLPQGWQPGNSKAVQAYRYDEAAGVLEVLFVDGRQVYDFPCDAGMYQRFLSASSKGRFVTAVLRPHARALGWARPPRAWPGS